MLPVRNIAVDQKLLKRLAKKAYRDEYMAARVRSNIAYQVRGLRKRLNLSQSEFAELIGKPQSVVSRIENAEYGRVSVQTLIEVATALDIAVMVKFCGYPEFLQETGDASSAGMNVETIGETTRKVEALSEHPKAVLAQTFGGAKWNVAPAAVQVSMREVSAAVRPLAGGTIVIRVDGHRDKERTLSRPSLIAGAH